MRTDNTEKNHHNAEEVSKKEKKVSVPYQIFMLCLSCYVLLVTVVTILPGVSPQIIEILNIIDFGVCTVFFIDFIFQMIRAENTLRYFFTWGWLDLLSSIPVLDYSGWARFARVLRIVRLIRGLKSAKIIIQFIVVRRSESVFLSSFLITIILMAVSSIGVLYFEQGSDSGIQTAGDAVWWAFVTVTTVGYGDLYPVTTGGRIVASVLMTVGVGFFGVSTGYIISLVASDQKKEDPPV